MSKPTEALKIVGLCTAGGIAYGIVNDQILVRVSLEYFTVGHKPIFGDQSLTALGILWGFTGASWPSFMLGTLIASAATLGSYPVFQARSLLRPFAVLISIMAGCALAAGLLGHYLIASETITLSGPYAERIPKPNHAGFLADAFANNTSYLVAIAGSLVILRKIWQARKEGSMKSSEAV